MLNGLGGIASSLNTKSREVALRVFRVCASNAASDWNLVRNWSNEAGKSTEGAAPAAPQAAPADAPKAPAVKRVRKAVAPPPADGGKGE